MQNFWIDYALADAVLGTVPVSQCSAGFYFDDGAYDAYDHNPDAYDAWRDMVTDHIAPLLSLKAHGETVLVDGWLFARNNLRDMNGRM